MISRSSLRTKGKALAQDPGPGTAAIGVQLLLSDPADHDTAILQALELYRVDRPNVRVVDQVIAVAGFRQILAGSGALSGLAGLDAWVDGLSQIQAVYAPWAASVQGAEPIDGNVWRVVRDPGPTVVLELLDRSLAIGDTVRLVFTGRHTLTEAPNVVDAPGAPSGTLVATAGSVTNGTHSYQATYITAQGETTPSAASNVVTVVDSSTSGTVSVVVPLTETPGVTAVRLYRTAAGDTGDYKRVGEFAVTAYSTNGLTCLDDVADGSLGAVAPSTNTAGGLNTVLEADEDALAALTASVILQIAAVRAVQNTGNTGLPNDVVDRRTQSDIFRSRAKEMRELYNTLVGKGSPADLAGASATRDLDVPTKAGVPRLWQLAGAR